jgi:hypothetical protein
LFRFTIDGATSLKVENHVWALPISICGPGRSRHGTTEQDLSLRTISQRLVKIVDRTAENTSLAGSANA